MPLILSGNVASATASTGYEVANSCRFDDGSSAYMTRTPSAGNQKTYTISVWIKRSNLGIQSSILSVGSGSGSNPRGYFWFASTDQLGFDFNSSGGSWDCSLKTTQLLRDPSAWMHLCVAVDTTQGTDTNRVKIYINGTQVTALATSTYPAEDADSPFMDNLAHDIGRYQPNGSEYTSTQMAEFVIIDGQALTPTSFGEFDSDTPSVFKPIDVSGLTPGTAGTYLDFEDSSNLGNDAFGGTDFTESGLAATDQATDTPTNNFCTMNPLAVSSSATAATFSNGNLNVITGSGAWKTAPSTIGLTQGKWYYEVKSGTINAANAYIQAGVSSEQALATNIGSYHQSTTYSSAYHWDGQKYVNNSASSFDNAITTGDIVMIALDLDNNYIYGGLNGTWQDSGDPESGGSGTGALSSLQSGQTWFLTISGYNNTHEVNFGSPAFAISSGNADADGYGNFEYAVPSGYYALCTKNLAEFG